MIMQFDLIIFQKVGSQFFIGPVSHVYLKNASVFFIFLFLPVRPKSCCTILTALSFSSFMNSEVSADLMAMILSGDCSLKEIRFIPDQRSAAGHIFNYASAIRTASKDISDPLKRTMTMQCRKRHIACRIIPFRDDSDAVSRSLLKSVMCCQKNKKKPETKKSWKDQKSWKGQKKSLSGRILTGSFSSACGKYVRLFTSRRWVCFSGATCSLSGISFCRSRRQCTVWCERLKKHGRIFCRRCGFSFVSDRA